MKNKLQLNIFFHKKKEFVHVFLAHINFFTEQPICIKKYTCNMSWTRADLLKVLNDGEHVSAHERKK